MTDQKIEKAFIFISEVESLFKDVISKETYKENLERMENSLLKLKELYNLLADKEVKITSDVSGDICIDPLTTEADTFLAKLVEEDRIPLYEFNDKYTEEEADIEDDWAGEDSMNECDCSNNLLKSELLAVHHRFLDTFERL